MICGLRKSKKIRKGNKEPATCSKNPKTHFRRNDKEGRNIPV